MSEATEELLASLKPVRSMAGAVVSEFKKIVSEIASDATRMGAHGATEMASALFNGHAFVLYGPAQRTPAKGEPQQDQCIER